MGRRVVALVILTVFAALLPASADVPVSKRCVGDPPRQTEDPMSPPCVPFFDGANPGETYRGVTAREIRVLVYVDAGSYAGEPTPPAGSYVDLDAAPKPACTSGVADSAFDCDHIVVRATRALASHFRDRWQTYGRRVHHYVYFSGAQPSLRRQEARDNWRTIRPFAVLDQAVFGGGNSAYVDEMASLGVMVFATPFALQQRLYSRRAPLIWTFWPEIAERARLFASYVCTKVAPHPVAHDGPIGSRTGDARVFGLYYTVDPEADGLLDFRVAVRKGLARCGVQPAAEASFAHEGFTVDGREPAPLARMRAVRAFQQAGVTTVLWLGGVETGFTTAAAARSYFPEIVFAGDFNLDSRTVARWQNPLVWRNAWGVHYALRIDDVRQSAGYRAARESSPSATEEELTYADAFYRDHFMLHLAIQNAGPYLDPSHVNAGLRAMPAHRSTGPYDAACYFGTRSHSCVKDAAEIWWDPTGTVPDSAIPGCYRMVREGARAVAGGWSGVDDVFVNPSDPCTAYSGTFRLRL